MRKLTAALLALMLVLSLCACDLFEGECTVTFNLNGGTAGEGFAESVTVKKGESVPLTTPTKDNYAFLGWFDGDTLYTAETPIEKDVTLVAQWSFANTYTLTFETNGMADVPKMHPVVGELPAIPATPVVDGYVFFGWYFDAELTNRYFFDYPLTEDTTLYAKFYDTTLGEYIVLSNVEQLMAVKDAPDAKYLLACDINCKGETLVPIDEFTGELEGNGYKIYNYTMSESGLNVALIRTNRGTVKNLSFSDFTFDIKRDSDSSKFYAVICGINYGSIENCAILDGEMNIACDLLTSSYTLYVGSVAAQNFGTVVDCKNNAMINVHTTQGGYFGSWPSNYWHNREIYIYFGGLVGCNQTDAVVRNGINTGKLNHTSVTETAGYSYNYIGGLVGKNDGDTLDSGSCCEVSVTCTGNHAYIRLGGAVGENTDVVKNCSSQGAITIDNAATSTENYIGGFAGYTCGKIHNCYSASDITDKTAVIKAIGGFAGYNEKLANKEYVIHKSFSTGSISISGTAENVGKFIGLSTGTERDCAYLDTMTITNTTVVDGEETTETVEPTNTIGNAMAEKDLLSVDFLENTLYFDRMVWFLVEGKLPALR